MRDVLTRRTFLKWLAAAAAVTAAPVLSQKALAREPDPALPPSEKALAQVLSFLSTKTNVICLGDTGHQSTSLLETLYNRPFLQKIAQNGISDIILERDEAANQEKFSALQQGTSTETPFFETFWQTGRQAQDLNDRVKKALYGLKAPLFHASTRGKGFEDLPLSKQDRNRMADLVARLKRSRPMDRSPMEEILPLIAEATKDPKINADIVNFSFDDKASAKNILSKIKKATGACLVIFGAAHFHGPGPRDREKGADKVLYDYFQEEGLRPLHINFFGSEKEREVFYGRVYAKDANNVLINPPARTSDVDFFVQKDGQIGLVFFNKELYAAYTAWDGSPRTFPERRERLRPSNRLQPSRT